MLGKAPAPAVNHLWPKRIEPERMVTHHKSILHMRKWGISCRLSQKRRENPAAAYDLMDDFTVLPPDNNNNDSHNTSPTVKDDVVKPELTKRVTANFGRLKAQKVKAIVQRASRVKRDMDESNNELDVQDASPFISTVEGMGRKKKDNPARRGGRVSNPSNSHEFRDALRNGKRDDSEYSGVTTRIDYEPLNESRHKPYMRRQSDTKVDRRKPSVSRGTRGWGNGGSDRDSFDFPDLDRRRKVSNDNDFFSKKSFRDVGCSEDMIECLKKQLFRRPSHIQAMAFPSVVTGKSSIIADQSGSGKTLAYLAPVIQRLREEELQGLSKSTSQSPRLVVLVPTAELASQVLGVCRSMSKSGVPVRSMVVTGGHRQKTQLESLQESIDVLIATPGRFMYLIKEGFLQLSNLRSAVLDEVDILFNDEDFEAALQSLISSSPVTTQYLFVTATLPLSIYNKLVEDFPDCQVVMAPGMHRVSPGLEEVLVDCSGDQWSEKSPEMAFSNKKSALLQLVEGNSVPKTIVFCNKIETCRKVENVLTRFDRSGTRVQVLPFHSALAQEARLANMKEFTNSRSEGVQQFLVCTDRASRGIDFAGVDHVILFDFPRDPSEYVRRVGRTARGAGGMGKAFVFVVGKQVSLAQRILDRNQKGRPVHDVPAAYELLY